MADTKSAWRNEYRTELVITKRESLEGIYATTVGLHVNHFRDQLLGLRVNRFKGKLLGLLSELEAINRIEVPQVDRGIDLKSQVRNFEISLIEAALSITGGSQTKAASLLNLKTSTLNAKIKLYRIACRKSMASHQDS